VVVRRREIQFPISINCNIKQRLAISIKESILKYKIGEALSGIAWVAVHKGVVQRVVQDNVAEHRVKHHGAVLEFEGRFLPRDKQGNCRLPSAGLRFSKPRPVWLGLNPPPCLLLACFCICGTWGTFGTPFHGQGKSVIDRGGSTTRIAKI
jgi:hypothetical protein